MSLSRRAFVRSFGLGVPFSDSLIAARGREAWAAEAPFDATEDDFQRQQTQMERNLIRISSNENPLGPGMAARDAMIAAMVDSNRYPMNAQKSASSFG